MRFFLLFCCVLCAAAQQSITSATVGGTVADSSGGVLPGAAVRLNAGDTGRKFATVADRSGRFQFLAVPPGSYVLTVSSPNFQQVERPLNLSAGQALDIPVVMRIAGEASAIDVTAQSAMIESVRTQTSGAVTSSQIDAVPLNGRNYLDLALMVAGVSRTNLGAPQQFAETSAVPGTGISISGQRNLNNNFILDGLSANDDAAGLAGSYFGQEVIREFQVITAGGNAEFGRSSSGVVSVISRSGTNDWHGRGYGFLRNQRFDARNALAARKLPLTQAQYGATIGGPLIHERTFLFANFEHTQRNASGLVTISPENVEAIQAALAPFGLSSSRVATGEYATGWDMSNFFAKVDHSFATSHRVAARYSLYDVDSPNARSVGGLNALTRGTALADRDQNLAVSEVAAISARNLNEFRFQFTRSRLRAPGNDLLGPSISIAGVANFGASTSSPTARSTDLLEWSESFSMQRGPHFIKVGADALYNRLNIEFPGSLVAAAYSFSNVAALAAGRYTTFQQSFGIPNQVQSNPNIGFFAQDEWKLNRNWTMNLGLRYDLQFLESPIRTDTNNIAPRFGIAWSPDNRKMVVRANYGLYYDRTPLRAVSNALQRDGSKYKTALLVFGQPGAPAFPAQLPAFPASQYINITTIDPAIENSYSHQAGIEVERQLAGPLTLAVGYHWVRALHLILSRNANVPTLSAAEASARGIPNLGRPDSRYGNISRYEGSGDSYYNGLLVSLRAPVGRRGYVRVAYTLSKTIDDVGNAFFNGPQNNFNLRDDRGLSDNDQRHRITASAALDLWRGWQFSPILTYTSPLPYNVLVNFDRNNDTSTNDRPAGLGRNTARGFDYLSLDLRLSRTFAIAERWKLQLMGESFNTLNRANWSVPNNVIGTASFGRPTVAMDPRQLQMGLRLDF